MVHENFTNAFIVFTFLVLVVFLKNSHVPSLGYKSLTFTKTLSLCMRILWVSFFFPASWLCSLISSQWSLDFFGDLREGDSLLSIPLSCVVCQWAHKNCHSEGAPEHEPVRHLKCHCSLTDNLIENAALKTALICYEARIVVITSVLTLTFPYTCCYVFCILFFTFFTPLELLSLVPTWTFLYCVLNLFFTFLLSWLPIIFCSLILCHVHILMLFHSAICRDSWCKPPNPITDTNSTSHI